MGQRRGQNGYEEPHTECRSVEGFRITTGAGIVFLAVFDDAPDVREFKPSVDDGRRFGRIIAIARIQPTYDDLEKLLSRQFYLCKLAMRFSVCFIVNHLCD